MEEEDDDDGVTVVIFVFDKGGVAVSVEIGPIELGYFDIIEVYNSSIETIPNS